MANETISPDVAVETVIEQSTKAASIISENSSDNAVALGNAAENVWDTYLHAFSTKDAYIELLAIGIAIVVGGALALLLRWVIQKQFEKMKKPDHWNWLLKPTKLLIPLFVIVALSVAKSIVLAYVPTPIFFYPATQIAVAWMLIYALHMMLSSKLMAWFLSVIIAILIGLQSFELLQPITLLLKSVGFKIGTMEVTVFGIFQGLIICVLVFWLARASTGRIEKQLKKSKINYNIRELLIKFSKIGIYFTALLITLNAMGVDLTAFAVFGGALGVGIGLGLQKITANFVSGITLLMERSIRQGDLIQVDGVHGYVRALNIRYTLVETFGGQEVSIPNESLTSNNIINWTMSNAKARVEIPVGVAYGSDYKLVQRLLLQAASEHERTMKDPAPTCYMMEFADSSVNFILQFWIGNVVDGIYSVQSAVMMRIAELFDEHKINIPFPQRDLHIFDTRLDVKTAD